MYGYAQYYPAQMRFNHLLLFFLSLVILLDSKAQQTELEWISYPPNGVSLQYLCIAGTWIISVPHPPVFSDAPHRE